MYKKKQKFTIGNILNRIVVVFVIIGVLSFITSAHAQARTVTLTFVDSVMINDTLIRVGDIARVTSDDAGLAARVRQTVVGEAAPAGFSRFVNSEDLVIFRLTPQFQGVRINSGNSRRVKVLSDYQERTVADYETVIREYVAERLEWREGEWELTITNLSHSWKSSRRDVSVSVAGLDNPFAKGGVSLTLLVAQGSRVQRIPVQGRITVTAPVLVASRTIQRGEELTRENTTTQVVDITSFAFVPMRELPPAGTMNAMRTVSQGNVLHDRVLRAIPLVARGDQVRIHFVGERVRISVIGIARDSGGQGDRIWVENTQSGRLVRTTVTGRGAVAVHQEG